MVDLVSVRIRFILAGRSVITFAYITTAFPKLFLQSGLSGSGQIRSMTITAQPSLLRG